MKIKILMLTCNRPDYTRICLGGLLDSLGENATVTVWDNGSGPETLDVLRSFSGHPRLEEVIYSPENKKLREPTNWFWEKSTDCDFLGKVDDDCLLPKGWCERILDTHAAFPKSGILGSWRFYDEDLIPELVQKKLRQSDGQAVMQNCWVQGSGYLMRRQVVDRLGLLREGESFPAYCIRAAAAGFLNGFCHPFIFEDHFDDPRSAYSKIKTDADLAHSMPLSAVQFHTRTVADWLEHQRREARVIQEASCNPYDYIGLRARLRRLVKRVTNRLQPARPALRPVAHAR